MADPPISLKTVCLMSVTCYFWHIILPYSNQHGGWWLPGAYLMPMHLQPLQWRSVCIRSAQRMTYRNRVCSVVSRLFQAPPVVLAIHTSTHTRRYVGRWTDLTPPPMYRYFAEVIFKCIFMNEKCFIRISTPHVPILRRSNIQMYFHEWKVFYSNFEFHLSLFPRVHWTISPDDFG